MFSAETLIMVSAISLCVGGLIGAIISRTLLPPGLQRTLESQLSDSRDNLEKYQQEVAAHFAETSQLVSKLTQSYKEVHDHLAMGATQLTNHEISQQLIKAGDSTLGLEAKEANQAINTMDIEPPKDWAPKKTGEAGVLSEEFGLIDEDTDKATAPMDPSTPPKI